MLPVAWLPLDGEVLPGESTLIVSGCSCVMCMHVSVLDEWCVCTLFTVCLYRACCCSCEKVELDVNDLLSYAHFLNVSLKYSLCEGKVSEALNFGK